MTRSTVEVHSTSRAAEPAGVVCPFDLTVEPMAAMLNCELAGHPVYDGLELQRFDDDVHGSGMLVFLSRRETRRIDCYVEPGLRLDRETYEIGGGVGEWIESRFDVARLTVADDGVEAEVRFLDVDGRPVEVIVDDRDGGSRRRGALLAPVSAGIEHPRSLLLVWMPAFDLVRREDGVAMVRIDGEEVSTGTLPFSRLHRRRLIKYAADLQIITVNRAQDGPVAMVRPEDANGVVLGRDGRSVAALRAGPHGEVGLRLWPPVPDPRVLTRGEDLRGRWSVRVGARRLTGGGWAGRRTDGQVELEMDVTDRWQPQRLPLLMRVVTTIVPTFRRWPTTYRWRGVVSDLGGARTPRLVSGWERTEQIDDTYRKATGSAG